uniref:Uncharacterized protein n=1 Tax=Lactuca sativa TaxID=4236 RepID=A0A9R1XK97_LACSA|nr:hypothetical protein LSAT_V11C400219120 [Lactuca sativa]
MSPLIAHLSLLLVLPPFVHLRLPKLYSVTPIDNLSQLNDLSVNDLRHLRWHHCSPPPIHLQSRLPLPFPTSPPSAASPPSLASFFQPRTGTC